MIWQENKYFFDTFFIRQGLTHLDILVGEALRNYTRVVDLLICYRSSVKIIIGTSTHAVILFHLKIIKNVNSRTILFLIAFVLYGVCFTLLSNNRLLAFILLPLYILMTFMGL